MTTTKEIGKLEELFKLANKEIFKNEISIIPVITFNPDDKGKTLGHFVCGEIWSNKKAHKKATELNIVCSVERGKESIIETMLHEMIHLYCYEHKIKDTSNQGVYHNKKFKEISEKYGLKCQKGRYGYNYTELDKKGKEFAKTCKIDLGNMTRKQLNKESKKQKAYKYECPICHAKWRTTKEHVLFCSGKKDNLHAPTEVKPEEINGEEN